MEKSVVVIGSCFLGMMTGVTLASLGHHVTVLDTDTERIKRLKKGVMPFYEPGLEERVYEFMQKQCLHFEDKKGLLLTQADVIYVTTLHGLSQQNQVQETLEREAAYVSAYANNNAIVMLKGSVPVGTTRQFSRQLLQPLQVGYESSFLTRGSALRDAFKGERTVIGTTSNQIKYAIRCLYETLDVPLFETTIETAELIQYVTHAFLATKISLINELADICEEVGVDIEHVSEGVGMDSRIGHSFLQAGLAHVGSRFFKDTHALKNILRSNLRDSSIIQAVLEVQEARPRKIFRAIQQLGPLHGKRIVLLGLAESANTDCMIDAPSITITELLLQEGATVLGYDPIVSSAAKEMMPSAFQLAESIEEALYEADLAVLMTDWVQIEQYPFEGYKTFMKTPLLFDARNVHDPEEASQSGIQYYSVGRKPAHVTSF
ncbi:UDP-glucose/GDP-mannose dehydrogenase family protein [Bacillaceae bacterium SIJ1]|uniref:UDP-glucose dehydrogenase family protein n=1 Tax=Litoribacterium kuwaitense TaxID=1398745 RepID=UPI0013EA789D|nr:nucleotide sugar dehydrogenase [Litoribacterium kuwaitense]NGP45621.1 UDP-glucose/GDP-mannose dehydrogenase family protein [Litoribacterium kuwaitense]